MVQTRRASAPLEHFKVNVRDLAEALSSPGLLRFIGRHRAMCFREFAQPLDAERFCPNLHTLVPDIRLSDLETGGSGVRAQAMLPDGRLVEDFPIVDQLELKQEG